jgi:hypothetical protein
VLPLVSSYFQASPLNKNSQNGETVETVAVMLSLNFLEFHKDRKNGYLEFF